MEKTACLIVDVQQAATAPLPDGGEGVTKRLSRLIAWCRQQMVPLVYVRQAAEEGEISPIDPRIQPREGELVLDKSYNSAFLETELEDWCGEQGITQLIVAGMMTELCVDATIQSAFERGYQVLVPQGCCATYDNEYLTAEQAEAYDEQKLWPGRSAQVVSLDDLLSQATRYQKAKKEDVNFSHPLFVCKAIIV